MSFIDHIDGSTLPNWRLPAAMPLMPKSRMNLLVGVDATYGAMSLAQAAVAGAHSGMLLATYTFSGRLRDHDSVSQVLGIVPTARAVARARATNAQQAEEHGSGGLDDGDGSEDELA